MTLPDIFRISEFQTASDFHFRVENIQCLAAISTPDITDTMPSHGLSECAQLTVSTSDELLLSHANYLLKSLP